MSKIGVVVAWLEACGLNKKLEDLSLLEIKYLLRELEKKEGEKDEEFKSVNYM